MASVRGYSEMSQYAPRPPEGVWGFVNSKYFYELVEESGRVVQRYWLRCSGGLRWVRSIAKSQFVTGLKFGVWFRQISMSVKSLSFYFTNADVETRNIIDKLANFVARNGPEFEQMTQEKQRDNPKFFFLFGGEFNAYYRWKVASEQAGS